MDIETPPSTVVMENNDATISKRGKNNKRRRGSVHNSGLFSHFILLDEKYAYPSSGKTTNCFACICIYCQQAYDARVEKAQARGSFSVLVGKPPDKIKREKRVCEIHLKNCRHVPRDAKQCLIGHTKMAPSCSSATVSTLTANTTSSMLTANTASSSVISGMASLSGRGVDQSHQGNKKLPARSTKQTSIEQYGDRPMTAAEVENMEALLVELINMFAWMRHHRRPMQQG